MKFSIAEIKKKKINKIVIIIIPLIENNVAVATLDYQLLV